MAGIITYALEKNSGLTAARKDGVWYHPVLLFNEIGKDGDFTKPLRYKIEKTNEQILFHGYATVSHLIVDQDLKKRWRKIIRQVEKGQEPVHQGADILMSIQKYYCVEGKTNLYDGRKVVFRRFIPWPMKKEQVLLRIKHMLRVRYDRGRPFIGDVVKLTSPDGFICSILVEEESDYDGKALHMVLSITGFSAADPKTYESWV